MAFTGLYVIVPNSPAPWRDGLIGGLLAVLLLGILKLVFALYFMVFRACQNIYGALATIPIFLIWLYAYWTVNLIGAVFGASFSDFSNIIAQLIAAGYVEMSEDQSLLLAHDPTSASLYDLCSDLGLATATETTDESGDPPAEKAGALAALRRRRGDRSRSAAGQHLSRIAG